MPDDPTFSEIEFRAEYGRVVAYLCYHGFARHIAEDAAAEAMAAAWEKKVKAGRRAGWVRVAAKRSAVRKVKDDPLRRLRAKGYLPPGAEDDGTHEYRAVEQHDELVAAMRSLPENQRAVMALFLDGLSPKEVAGRLRMPERTAYDLLKRARTHLRSVLVTNEKEGTR
ncbi:sigma-70 family RNA polymerase sigma factor [Actinosynnema sp. NPDC047251]|nr:sigma-70 family RNA polymerase sigma factor [Saccharothrix espanaensis]